MTSSNKEEKHSEEVPVDNKQNATSKPGEQNTNVEIFNKVFSPPDTEEEKKEEEKYKRDRMFATIGNGISALSNLYFTTRGAPNMYTGEDTITERMQKRHDQLKKDREKRKAEYFDRWMKARQADESTARYNKEWERTLGLDEYKKGRDKVSDNHFKQQIGLQQENLGLRRKSLDLQEKAIDEENRRYDSRLQDQKDAVQAKANKAARGERLQFYDDKNNQIEIYDNVWKSWIPRLYDMLVEDKIVPDGQGTIEEQEACVKQYLHKSPRVIREMQRLSKIDPAVKSPGWGKKKVEQQETDWP